MGSDEGLLRRQAVHLATQLPESTEDALKVLELTREIVLRFLTVPQRSRSGAILAFPAAINGGDGIPEPITHRDA